MAQFILYKTPASAGASDRCFRIVNPNQTDGDCVWDNNAGEMKTVAEVEAGTFNHTAIALTHIEGINGYVLAIPDALPVGDYDLLIYNVAQGSAANTDSVEVGYAFKWNGDNLMKSRREIMTDLVK